ncbi:hypothetical protein [Pseudonocardia sp. ICBG601]|uniref:hypothetical protein n=1 Tax=Pseudonocardia sp. ICBG601 TaxID=2846759 RepID=UPI0035ABBED0
MSLLPQSRWARRGLIALASAAVVAGVVAIPASAQGTIDKVKSEVTGADGKNYWSRTTSRRRPSAVRRRAQEGVRPGVWAGDENIADTAVADVRKPQPARVAARPVDKVRDALPGPDFLAVVDVTKGTPDYGKVVNTATVGPLVENEPHHMQYSWRKGDKIYAGGLFTAATYVFDVAALPEVKLSGISLPSQTLCGSVPDAYWVLKDGTAYGTYMGGPVAPGPCRYTNGEVRTGNGFAGAPGSVIRFDQEGRNLVEAPAATETPEDPTSASTCRPWATPPVREPARDPGPRGPEHHDHQ